MDNTSVRCSTNSSIFDLRMHVGADKRLTKIENSGTLVTTHKASSA